MSVRIYHTSDLHDHRGIAPRLRALRAAQPGLLFDCGDSLRGSQTVYFRDEPIVADLESAGYDAQGMGNREFHYLFGVVRARIAAMRYPVVCANLIDLRRRPLPFRETIDFAVADGETTRCVRIVALLVPQYPVGSLWERIFGWRFLPPVDVARRYAEQKPAGTALVVLSHLGLRADRELARQVAGIDLVLGGHSHDTLHVPEIVGETPIVHAGPYGRFVSRSDLQFEGDRVRLVDYALIPLLEAA